MAISATILDIQPGSVVVVRYGGPGSRMTQLAVLRQHKPGRDFFTGFKWSRRVGKFCKTERRIPEDQFIRLATAEDLKDHREKMVAAVMAHPKMGGR